MYNTIVEELKVVEAREDFKILFAIESGSRLWGLNNDNSDWDVRFVYCYPKEYYLSLNKPRDSYIRTIELEEGIIDLVGFDIYKFMYLISKSNPNSLEWIKSNIIYNSESQVDELLSFVENNINLYTLAMAYRGMGISAMNTIKHEMVGQYNTPKEKRVVCIKQTLYALRGIIAGEYILHNKKTPPTRFITMVEEDFLNPEIKNLTHSLIMNIREGGKIVSYGEIEPIMNYLYDSENEKSLLNILKSSSDMRVGEGLLFLNKWILQFLS